MPGNPEKSAQQTTIYQVAVASPLRRLFDYLPARPPASGEQGLLAPGCRVRVPFGRRQVVGFVVKTQTESKVAPDKLKTISEVIDPVPLISPTLFGLYLWSASYYQYPIGEALANCFPTRLRQGEPIPNTQQKRWRLTTHGLALPSTALKRAPRQQQLLQLLQQRQSVSVEEIKTNGLSGQIVKQLQQKGLIESFDSPTSVQPWGDGDCLAESPLRLYQEQQQALEAIKTSGFNTYLLQGETGSGKTEVYLQLIEKIIGQGKQALVLIPEINLTPQTLQRFKTRFACPVAVLHSGLTDLERATAWNQARTGEAAIVLGTRSGIFTPLKNPGLLIIDEEHDAAFKQQDGFHYSARDVAVMRAKMESVPLLLGSATPSLESIHNANTGRYTRLILSRRAGSARPPTWQLVNLREKKLNAGFSAELIAAIEDELRQQHQVMIFLNRRGYAPTLSCHSCGWIAGCHHCEARLTVHRQIDRLLCHHCEHQQKLPPRCPNCHSGKLQFLGQGTERSEAILDALFPDTPVLRVDRDSTRRKNAMQGLLDQVNQGEPCILVGTQMLAKGHHFPNVTLVVILDVDGGLFTADFRAPERMGQLITQVAGRAGRGDKPGRVILQSHHCDHPLIQTITGEGYAAFAESLLNERKLAELPPYSYMALLRAESTQREDAEAFLRDARREAETLLPPSPDCRYLGPLPPPMEKRSGLFRQQISISCDRRQPLQAMLTTLSQKLENNKKARKLRWSIDIDPQDMS